MDDDDDDLSVFVAFRVCLQLLNCMALNFEAETKKTTMPRPRLNIPA